MEQIQEGEEMKINCIVKRPDEKYGHMTAISDTLENLQRTVGGYIEPVTLGEVERDDKQIDIVLLCDEDGKLFNKPKNIILNWDIIVGDVVIVGADGEDFCDIPITFAEWREMLPKIDRGWEW